MKVVKTLLTLVLVVGLLGGAAYGAGRLIEHRNTDTVASSSTGGPKAPTSSNIRRTSFGCLSRRARVTRRGSGARPARSLSAW
jgi:hypothetical protein